MTRTVCAALFCFVCASADASDPYLCAKNPEIVAPCFEVHGRLSSWNGAPATRIWRVGTKRVLGIHSDIMPPELQSKRATFDTELWGTFLVCPYTHAKAGHMQFVCIESWRDIQVRERRR